MSATIPVLNPEPASRIGIAAQVRSNAKAKMTFEPAKSTAASLPSAAERKKMSWNELFGLWDSLGAADPDFARQTTASAERDFI